MDQNNLIFYLAIGFGLIFMLPVAESAGENLNYVATFLVLGYWGTMGLGFFLFLLKKFVEQYRVSSLLYNLWLFISLMCVAVGVLAIVDDGIDQAKWAVGLILYGGTVGYFNRSEL